MILNSFKNTKKILKHLNFNFFSFLIIMTMLQSNIFSNQEKTVLFKALFDEALSSRIAYENLRYLCKNFPGRICGTPQAAGAVEFTKQIMEKMDLDRVYLQEVMVKNWKRGEKETATITSQYFGSSSLSVCALGGSIGTGKEGLVGEVVEVKGIKDLQSLGSGKISGKIVFFNGKLDPTQINTFAAYGRGASQRTSGAAEAAKYGAIGTVIRSLTLSLDNFPHTGVMQYQSKVKKIPAIAVSTIGAEQISLWLRRDPNLKLYFRTTCKSYPDVKSFNVIGEIKGTSFPEKIITVGGHLDAWDNGEGAHDDGGGCIQSIEVLRLFKKLKIRPRHTLRAVMFMDEEVAQRGGNKYAEAAYQKGEKHIAAIESDRGVMVPRAIGITAPEGKYRYFKKLETLFQRYGINIVKGGGGVDIGPLRNKYRDIILVGLITDDQRYFDYHHSPNDTFEQVNLREMQMGSAAIAALVTQIDEMDH